MSALINTEYKFQSFKIQINLKTIFKVLKCKIRKKYPSAIFRSLASIGTGVGQLFSKVGLYKGVLVAIKKLRKEHIQITRQVLLELSQVRKKISYVEYHYIFTYRIKTSMTFFRDIHVKCRCIYIAPDYNRLKVDILCSIT